MKNLFFAFTLIFTTGSSWALYSLRLRIFPNWTATAVGSISFEADEALSDHINSYFESYHQKKASREYVCAHHLLGRDQAYAYIQLVCGMFKELEHGSIQTLYGYGAPTRIRMAKRLKILSFSQPVDGSDYWASYNWLFPGQIQAVDQSLKDQKKAWYGLDHVALKRLLLKSNSSQ